MVRLRVYKTLPAPRNAGSQIYSGMDVYTSELVGPGQPHDVFYTNSATQAAYKEYVKAFVTRYVNEPTILGWELG